MIRLRTLCLALALLITACPARDRKRSAAGAAKGTPTPGPNAKQKACLANSRRVKYLMDRERSCWRHRHCRLVTFGCPFTCQGAVNHKALPRVAAAVAAYRRNCGTCVDGCEPIKGGAARCRNRICVVYNPRAEAGRRRVMRKMKRCRKLLIRYHRVRRLTFSCRRHSDCVRVKGGWPHGCFEAQNRRLARRHQGRLATLLKRYLDRGCPTERRLCDQRRAATVRCRQGGCVALPDEDDE